MNFKRISLIYLVSYLIGGGLGLTAFPDFFMALFQSNQDYGDIMPRFAGVFMMALGGLVGMILYHKDYKYYGFSVVARTIIVGVLFWLYAITKDPFFIVINVVVLVGLIPSYIIMLLGSKKEQAR